MGTTSKVLTSGFVFGFLLILLAAVGKSVQFIDVITRPFVWVVNFVLSAVGVSFSAPGFLNVLLFAIVSGLVYAIIFLLVDVIIGFRSKK